MDKYTISLPVIDRNLSNKGILGVCTDSPDDLRNGLETLARYFKREFHYDGIQYEANEHHFEHVEYKGFVFVEPALDALTEEHSETPSRLLGGCCFRHRQYSDGLHWILDWIWLHPYARRRGILKKHWKFFREIFGDDFHVTPPISPAMEAFLAKQRHGRQIKQA